jgi:prepilin-type processing-associated H-X9-DG protein
MIGLGDSILMTASRLNGKLLLGLPDLDAFGSADTDTTYYKSVMPGLPAKDSAVRAMKQRHGGRWNIGFCDGHVENLLPSGLFNAYNPAQMAGPFLVGPIWMDSERIQPASSLTVNLRSTDSRIPQADRNAKPRSDRV